MTPQESRQGGDEPVMVRVSPTLLEHIATTDSEPVVIVGIDRQEDGTYEMVLRTVLADPLPFSKGERSVILQGLRKLEFGYAREIAERIEATKCPACRGNGYAPYVGGDDDDTACASCNGDGFR